MSFRLVVYDAGNGNEEGEERKKLLAFYPETDPLDEQLAIAGLLQGLQIFLATLCDKSQVCHRHQCLERKAGHTPKLC